MTPGGHLVTTALAGGAIYASTGSADLLPGLVAGGFLIDVDHAVDYVCFEGQRDLRPGSFLRYYLAGRMRRVVLALHSYELLALAALLAWWTASPVLWGWTLGVALHLPLDVVFNGRYQPRGMAAFYSLAHRWRHGFDAERLLTRDLVGSVPASFTRAFFAGAAVRRPAGRGSRRAPRPAATALPARGA
jgi:hypothetical protein